MQEQTPKENLQEALEQVDKVQGREQGDTWANKENSKKQNDVEKDKDEDEVE